jgi:dephospho-CoA kinase
MSVAITGGIAEGKSTVLGYLTRLGYPTASADVAAKDVFEDPTIQGGLAELLGVELPVKSDDLREAIASRPALRRQVNRLMHPAIMQRLFESKAAFVEVPLLFEACVHGRYDQVWVVTSGVDEQMRRLTRRVGQAEAVRLLGVQLPTQAKEPFADHVIRTNRPEEAVFQEVRALALEVVDNGVCRSR